MWRAVVDLAKKEANVDLDFKVLMTDFECPSYESAKIVFKSLIIWTCRFHLVQAWWRFIQKEPALRKAYEDSTSAIGKYFMWKREKNCLVKSLFYLQHRGW